MFKNNLRSFIATVFVACLAVPGVASATFILDLTTFSPAITSPTTFTNPAGLGWDMTLTGKEGLTDKDINTDPAKGLGVDGGLSAGVDAGESIIFDFIPVAMLEGFSLTTDGGITNDVFTYNLAGNPAGTVTSFLIVDTTFNVISNANKLTIANVFQLAGNGFRVSQLLFADAVTGVPEPTILGLLGFGLLGVAGMRRMKKTA